MSRSVWDEVDRCAHKSEAEFRATENTINSMKGWRFLGVEAGVYWRASHRRLGRVCRNSGRELVDHVRSLSEEDERKQAEKTSKRAQP